MAYPPSDVGRSYLQELNAEISLDVPTVAWRSLLRATRRMHELS